jgi:hypothetical protein
MDGDIPERTDICPICGESHSSWGAAIAATHEDASSEQAEMPMPPEGTIPEEAMSELRCEFTKNKCGTDTVKFGHPCKCVPCQVWLRLERERALARLAGLREAKEIADGQAESFFETLNRTTGSDESTRLLKAHAGEAHCVGWIIGNRIAALERAAKQVPDAAPK